MTDMQEGYDDGIAGRLPQARAGDLPYIVGFASAAVDNLDMTLANVRRAIGQVVTRDNDIAAIRANMAEDD